MTGLDFKLGSSFRLSTLIGSTSTLPILEDTIEGSIEDSSSTNSEIDCHEKCVTTGLSLNDLRKARDVKKKLTQSKITSAKATTNLQREESVRTKSKSRTRKHSAGEGKD